jgi:ADP-ribosylation factor GTPase-activating protein 2/3
LGARKGLGAQKVIADFSKMEEEAKRAVQIKDEIVHVKPARDEPVTEEQQAENLKTMNESLEQMGEQINKKKEILRTLDKDKAEQFERLGMGAALVNQKSNISHSAAFGIRGFDKVQSVGRKNDVDSLLNNSSAPSRALSKMAVDDFFDVPKKESDFWTSFDDPLAVTGSSSRKPQVIESIQLLEPKRQSSSTSKTLTSSASETRSISTMNQSSSSTRTSGATSSRPSLGQESDSDTQRKFAGAKSISSDQYFGRSEGRSFENKSNLSRFQGSDAISSDAFFNRETHKPRSAYSDAISSANLYEIKEGVKDGVSKVAGRLSSLATDVFSSLHDKYGNL